MDFNKVINDIIDIPEDLSCFTNSSESEYIKCIVPPYDKLYDILSNPGLSQEYFSAFKYIFHHKSFNLSSKEGFNLHVYRNRNQEHMAPRDLETMKKFCKLGHFLYEGYSPCHNIVPSKDTRESRKAATRQTVKLYNQNKLDKPNEFAPMKNVSFRGTPNSDFAGCQFVYNTQTKKIVCDNANRGTWDFGKYGTIAHFFMDVLPWINVGNGTNTEHEEDYIMSDDDVQKYLTKHTKVVLVDIEKSSDNENRITKIFYNLLFGRKNNEEKVEK